jgi:hypothetical protein
VVSNLHFDFELKFLENKIIIFEIFPGKIKKNVDLTLNMKRHDSNYRMNHDHMTPIA